LERFARTRLLVGKKGLDRLALARVAVVGLGGVGGYALEALARAGIGSLFLVDANTVEPNNINRQILALDDTVGRAKVDVARERVLAINPSARVDVLREFLMPETVQNVLPDDVEYAIDAIDSVPTKVSVIRTLVERGVGLVSCMGVGGKLNPCDVRVADIGQTQGCPLARAVRIQLRKQGVYKGVRCVYSEENRGAFSDVDANGAPAKRTQGVISYMPGIVGLTAAGLIVNDILAGGQPGR